MDSTLLEKAMALYEQEQQQQSTPDCQHAFEIWSQLWALIAI